MQQHGLAAILALLACLASCTQAAGSAVCGPVSGKMGVIIGRLNPPSVTLTCGLGSAPKTRMVYKPKPADTRFVPANFA